MPLFFFERARPLCQRVIISYFIRYQKHIITILKACLQLLKNDIRRDQDRVKLSLIFITIFHPAKNRRTVFHNRNKLIADHISSNHLLTPINITVRASKFCRNTKKRWRIRLPIRFSITACDRFCTYK